MMDHKIVFREYGVRRPLKWRRLRAREGRRLWSQIGRNDKALRGWHDRWWNEGQAVLLFDQHSSLQPTKENR